MAPTITEHPAAATVTEGNAATFSVSATGTAPLAYQWKRGGVDIAGATGSTYTLAAATLADNGAVFSVTVSNSAGSVTSNAATLTVNGRPVPVSIASSPQSVTVAELQTVTLTVTVTGSAPLTYQWQRSDDGSTWADVAGATADSYTTPPLLRTDSGVRYRVIVDNAANMPAISAAAQITVTPDAAVLLPAGGTVSGDNDNIRLEVPAGALLGPTRFVFAPLSGIDALPPEWVLRAGTAYRIDVSGAGFAPGATASVLIRLPSSATARMQSTDRVRRQDGVPEGPPLLVRKCPNGQFVLTAVAGVTQEMRRYGFETCPGGSSEVGEVSPSPALLPRITQGPASISVPLGDSASFSVTATGPSLTYQWRRNGVDIPGATSSSYSIAGVTAADNGARFSVVVRNPYGSVTSAEATLTVGPPLLPVWSEAREIAPFATTSGYFPSIGGGAGPEFAVWSDGERLRGAGLAFAGSFAPVDTLDLPMRGSRAEAVSGPNLRQSYIVFVDDDGTGNCGPSGGNRLSAVAVSIGVEGQPIPRSPRFTLHRSADCIGGWQAGLVSPGLVVPLNSRTGSDVSAGLVFAVGDRFGTEVRVGIADVYFSISSSSPFAGTWVIPEIRTEALALAPSCSGGSVSVMNQGLKGVRQAFFNSGTTTQAVLATSRFSAGQSSVCTAVLTVSGSGTAQWSTAQPLFNESCNDLVTAIDGAGNALVVCNRGLSFSPPSFQMTAAYRPAAGAAWQIQPLDASASEAVPDAAFDASGNAIVVWRTTATAGAPTRVYAARRSAAGAWSATTAISPEGVDTRYPRISVLGNGEATAFFQLLDMATNRFRVHAVPFRGGSWREPVVVQRDGTNEGRFAVTQRNVPGTSFVGSFGPNTVWRETDASDPTRFRLVTARRIQ
ncbi:MAG: immunoglobulin domain-containing protein [Burkholderiaceae bacterium]|nr:immunoglobulin domain-containing protein [Burkholderiaceae bacterium]